MHTTGLVVKEAAERWEIPPRSRDACTASACTRPLGTLDLASGGYYFLATDTAA